MTFVLQLVVAAILVAGGWYVGGIAEAALRVSFDRKGVDPVVRQLVASLVRPLFVVVGLLAAADHLAVDLTAIVALVGAAGLAVGLALQGSLSNVASGAVLLTLRPFSGGDFVEIAGQSGTVVDFGLLAITLKTVDGVLVTLTNDAALKAPVRNFTRNGLRRVDVPLTLAHDARLEDAVAASRAVLAADAGVLSEPAATVRVTETTPQGHVLLVSAWCRAEHAADVRSRVVQGAAEALSAAGVSLAQAPRAPREP